jgi:hypothetical protein
MSYILEVPHIIFGNFGSFSSDFVHFWKLLLGCCVFMEVPHGNCCILKSYKELPKFTQSHEELPKMQDTTIPMRNFHKYTTSQEQI